MPKRILVPRFIDASNNNAQNLNAKALLSRFRDPECRWLVTHYHEPDPNTAGNPLVTTARLWQGRLSRLRMLLFYLQSADALFYPGGVPDALLGLRVGRAIQPKRMVIATLEGLAGNQEREEELSRIAGHRVHCHRIPASLQRRLDQEMLYADHVIAISPFLARVGKHLYGDKFSILPLGIDLSVFYPPPAIRSRKRPLVVSAGRVSLHKRPEILIELAKRHPEADFIWYGNGDLRPAMEKIASEARLDNLKFPGSLAPHQLAQAFRDADIFVLPSKSEGVPKVSQEAAACGLPIVLFGFYEAPSVIDHKNGFVVWDDSEFFERIAELVASPVLRKKMGDTGAKMAETFSWDLVAPMWEKKLTDYLNSENYKNKFF